MDTRLVTGRTQWQTLQASITSEAGAGAGAGTRSCGEYRGCSRKEGRQYEKEGVGCKKVDNTTSAPRTTGSRVHCKEAERATQTYGEWSAGSYFVWRYHETDKGKEARPLRKFIRGGNCRGRRSEGRRRVG